MFLQIPGAHSARLSVIAGLLAVVCLLLHPVSARAADIEGDKAQALLPLVVSMPSPSSPAFVSEPNTIGAVGVPYSYPVQASGYPAPLLSLSQGPNGMAIDGNGVIHWTPTVPGSQEVAIHASNGVFPDKDQIFDIDVAPGPTAPAITSSPALNAAVSVPYIYTVIASGYPAPEITLEQNTMPDGMTIDGDGVIQWAPTAEGVYTVTVRADNGVPPSAQQTFSINVAFSAPPQITSTPSPTGTVGATYLYHVQALGAPSPTFIIDEGPDGMTIDSDGLLQWTPDAGGSYDVTVRARNGVPPDANQHFTIEVPQAPSAPAFISEPVRIAKVGQLYAYDVAVSGYPTPTLELSIAPGGMAMDDKGHIEWTPTSEGPAKVGIRAANEVAVVRQTFEIDVASALPERFWDPRLDQRGVSLEEADVESGQLFWRLVEARWYDQYESEGRHHIFIDVLDQDEQRMAGVDVVVSWVDGSTVCTTELKPGEEYATDFPMANVTGSYSATPVMGLLPNPTDKLPADSVHDLGLGTIEDPYNSIHTSFRLVWQLTVMP
ncbi:MAG: Ig domain-containing protein [Caldilineaceae bacterium]